MGFLGRLRRKKDKELEVVPTDPEEPEEGDTNPFDLTKIAARGQEPTMSVGAIQATTMSVGAIQATPETLAQAPPPGEGEVGEGAADASAETPTTQTQEGSGAGESEGGEGTEASANPLLGIFDEESAVDEDLADLVARVEEVSASELIDDLKEISQSLGLS